MRFLVAFLDAIFWVFVENGRPKGMSRNLGGRPFGALGRPETLQKRIGYATSIFHRFSIDLGPHRDAFLILFGSI